MAKERPRLKTSYDLADELGLVALTPAQFIPHALHCAAINKLLVVIGRPGVGKTWLIKQIMAMLKKKLHIERFNGKDPTDLGFPYVTEDQFGLKRHAFTVPNWFVADSQEIDSEYPGGYGFFFDEFMQACMAMQNRVCEFDDGSLNGVPKHPLSWSVIASNFPQDKAGTNPLPSQIPNRASVVVLAPYFQDTVDFISANGLRSEVASYINLFKDSVDSFDPDQMVNPTSRSLCALSPVLDQNPAPEERLLLFSSIVGKGHGAQFEGHISVYSHLPKLKDIEANPDKEPIPDEDQTDVLCALSAMLGRSMDKTNAAPLIKYLVRLPSEFCVFALRDAARRTPELKKVPAMIQWANQHGGILA